MYTLPVFNLLCNIDVNAFGGVPGPQPGPFRISLCPCNLAWGRRVTAMSTGGTGDAGVIVVTTQLLLPPLTDVRGPQDTVAADEVEVPAGSGRVYRVVAVDDIGKGFGNEHRVAVLYALGGDWLAPYS
jgi:hypothetical protein